MKISRGTVNVIIILAIIVFFFMRAIIIETRTDIVPVFEKSSFLECPFKIIVKEYSGVHENYVNFTIKDKTYTLYGFFGKYICIPEGILLIAGYPGDPYASGTELLFLNYSLNKRWELYIAKAVWFNSYQDDKIILSNGCVYLVNVMDGSFKFFCPGKGVVTDVEEYDHFTYVTTTEGYLYLLENYKLKKRVRVAKPWKGENLRMLVGVGVGEKYVVAVYSFVRPQGDEKRGFCVYTRNLIKLACKRLDYTPKDAVVTNNTIYIKEFYTKHIKAYKIYSLL